ncbi:MAG: hypothetical protein U0U67_14830 [Chitinophagales bacterium]
MSRCNKRMRLERAKQLRKGLHSSVHSYGKRSMYKINIFFVKEEDNN